MDKIQFIDMDAALEVFANYGLIEIDRAQNKKDAKSNKIGLTVELEDLDNALEDLKKEQEALV